jgi:hypothetical protein
VPRMPGLFAPEVVTVPVVVMTTSPVAVVPLTPGLLAPAVFAEPTVTVTAGGLASGSARVVIPELAGAVDTVLPIARIPAELAPVVVTLEAVTETGPPLLA